MFVILIKVSELFKISKQSGLYLFLVLNRLGMAGLDKWEETLARTIIINSIIPIPRIQFVMDVFYIIQFTPILILPTLTIFLTWITTKNIYENLNFKT